MYVIGGKEVLTEHFPVDGLVHVVVFAAPTAAKFTDRVGQWAG
jgi:hypothetical protein